MNTNLDIEQSAALTAYLRARGDLLPDEQPQIDVLAGGVSNRTVRVTLPQRGETWVLKQALEKLRVSVDWFSSPQRIHREALGLRWLGQIAPPGTLPDFVFEDHDAHILAMRAVPEPHHNWKRLLLDGGLQIDHVQQFALLLGTIHLRAAHQREAVAAAFEDRSFFESLRLEPYYAYIAAQVQPASSFLNHLIAETRATRLTLVHGDYSPKNILVHQDRLILLDHEVIHYGDPAFDVGFSMTHLLSKAHHLPEQRAAFAQAALGYWQTYAGIIAPAEWSAALEARAVRHTLACLLARVAGRSPLEYLGESQRAHQRAVVLALLPDPPAAMPELIHAFLKQLDTEFT